MNIEKRMNIEDGWSWKMNIEDEQSQKMNI